jgi:hypothetical protein
MAHHQPVCLMVCTDDDCKESSGYRDLLATARGVDGAVAVRCQGICHGPVAGVVVKGEVRWFEKMRDVKRRKQLLDLVRHGHLAHGLESYEDRGRRGKVKSRKKAVALRDGRRVH